MTQDPEQLLSEIIRLRKQDKYNEILLLCAEVAPLFEANEQWEKWVYVMNFATDCWVHTAQLTEALSNAEKTLAKALTYLDPTSTYLATLYNNLGNIYYDKSELDISLQFHEKALAIFLRADNAKIDNIGSCYNNMGLTVLMQGNYDLALQYYQQSMFYYGQLDNEEKDLLILYVNIGAIYSYKSDYKHALQHYQQALAMIQKFFNEEHPHTAAIYNNIGACYDVMEKYDLATENYQKALALQLKMFGEQHLTTAGIYVSLSLLSYKKDNYEQAIDYLNHALRINLQLIGEQSVDVARIYSSFGVYYEKLKQDEKALQYFCKSLEISLQVFGQEHPEISEIYYNIGKYYQNRGNYNQALQNYQLSLKAISLAISIDNYYEQPILEGYREANTLLNTLTAKSETFYLKYQQTKQSDDLIAALAHYQSADALIDQLRHSYKANESKLIMASSKTDKVYEPAIEIAWAVHLQEIEKGIAFSQISRKLGYNQLSEKAIEMAFHFSEKSKAMLFFSDIKNEQAKAAAPIPHELLENVQQLQVELNYLDQLIAEETSISEGQQDKIRLRDLRSKHFHFHRQYNELIERLEHDFPEYYSLKYNTTISTISNLQKELNQHTALLEYFVGKEQLYIFCITANACTFHRVDLSSFPQSVAAYKPHNLEQLVTDFLQCIAQQNNNLSNHDLYKWFTDYAYALYELLIAPAQNHLISERITHLIIIPDAYLYRVPFETLLYEQVTQTTQNSYNSLPYLLNQFDAIEYHYSANLWHHYKQYNKHKAPDTQPSFVGFAPIQYDDTFVSEQNKTSSRNNQTENQSYTSLPYTEAEVQGIAQLFTQQNIRVQLFSAQNATPTMLKQVVDGKAATFIHIAGHGYYNEQHPELSGLVLSPPAGIVVSPISNKAENLDKQSRLRAAVEVKESMFYLSDTYGVDLHGTELVVLSCCDSGLGRFAPGEGMIALNRGFLYAGAHNVIYTLFKVDDERSYKLVQELYVHILAGKTYSQALLAAKKAVLPILGAPFFWSGYVLIGRGR